VAGARCGQALETRLQSLRSPSRAACGNDDGARCQSENEKVQDVGLEMVASLG
jgi:hypothetical protein